VIKRVQHNPGGAPAWTVTFADMMGLMLSFFVLLVALGRSRDDVRFDRVMQSLRTAFGYQGRLGLPDKEMVSLVKRLMAIQVPQEIQHLGSAPDPGIAGRHFRVTEIRDGAKLTFGGALQFERFSDRLLPHAELVLKEFAGRIRGLNNIIDIIGHTTPEELPPECGFLDKDDLAIARARIVRDHLQVLGIDPRRMRLVSAADREPYNAEAYTEARQARNRRVEIVVRESLIGEYEGRGLTNEGGDRHGGG
jgi:chemotaxis protein MotB